MQPSIKTQAINGAMWSFADKIGGQALSFLSFVILARLLAPEDFGIVSLAGAIVAVPALFLNEGFSVPLVQRKAISNDHINAAFWASLLLAICIMGLLQLSASAIGQLAGKPMVGTLIHWLSLSCIGIALNAIAGNLYVRQFRFSKFAQRSFISIATGFLVLGLSTRSERDPRSPNGMRRR